MSPPKPPPPCRPSPARPRPPSADGRPATRLLSSAPTRGLLPAVPPPPQVEALPSRAREGLYSSPSPPPTISSAPALVSATPPPGLHVRPRERASLTANSPVASFDRPPRASLRGSLPPRRRIVLRLPASSSAFERAPGAGALDPEVRLDDLRINARISGASPAPLSVVAALGKDLVQATEKRASSPSSAKLGRRSSPPLDDAFAGFDRSHGYLPRHTVWRWAFAMGHTTTGEKIALNLVDGFVGEVECVVWIGDKMYP
ncbi:MAG: DUF2804 family protein [Polyangiaceae bacterium]